MKRLATTIFAVLIVFGIARAQQNVVTPGDFNGGDLVLITGQSLTGGTYSNIRNFVIESGNEVSIIGATGVVTISAEHIRIAGVLNGIGAGYRGTERLASNPPSEMTNCSASIASCAWATVIKFAAIQKAHASLNKRRNLFISSGLC